MYVFVCRVLGIHLAQVKKTLFYFSILFLYFFNSVRCLTSPNGVESVKATITVNGQPGTGGPDFNYVVRRKQSFCLCNAHISAGFYSLYIAL